MGMESFQLHLVGMWVTFVASAVVITAFVTPAVVPGTPADTHQSRADTMDSVTEYHLEEQRAALDSNNDRHINPSFKSTI